MKHLHQVSLGRVWFRSSVAGATPESLPGLEMSLLLFLLELSGPQVEVTLLMNLKYHGTSTQSDQCTWYHVVLPES